MDSQDKVKTLYEGFAKDITGSDYSFSGGKHRLHKEIILCVKRALDQLNRVSNQTELQYNYWNDCIQYTNRIT